MNKPLPPSPFRVLIVGKTHMSDSFCVGGIAQNGRSVRLCVPKYKANANQEYNIGDVWRIDDYCLPEKFEPPHTEDIIVFDKEYLHSTRRTIEAIKRFMPPVEGGVDELYGGAVRLLSSGRLYIGREQVPDYSTLFWRPDRPLALCAGGNGKFRYAYPSDEGELYFSYAGVANAESCLPAGTLIRISLARWWRPEPNEEERCFLQVSGWFREAEPGVFPVALPSPAVQADEAPAPSKQTHPARQPVNADIFDLLHRNFGFREFRPLQREIIEAVLARRNTLVIMSTGAGKSLCYQLPALVFRGLTVVISPLISLMQDQVAHLTELGIAAAAFNGQLSESQRQQVIRQARGGKLRLLYLSPEMLQKHSTKALLKDCRVELLVVDEAHCISQWGHDFREEYLQISNVREYLGDVPMLALTATATRQVRKDIVENLELHDVAEFIAPFDRPNLHLSVQPRQDGLNQVLDFLTQHRNQSGIIYCTTKKQVDNLTAALNDAGVAALNYHAGLDDATRMEHQRRFIYDEVPVMVATVAFGMGIDKPDIRFVLHYNLPKDPESYYQQIGRAGRDGDRADCLMLYGPDDFNTIKYMISEGPADQQEYALERLQHMSAWIQHIGCRRKWLIEYFDGEHAAEQCEMCDNCVALENSPPPGADDLTPYATLFLSCVQQLKEMFGVIHVINVLRESKAKKVLKWNHDKLATYGQGKTLSKEHWQQLAKQFFAQKLMVQSDIGSVRLTQSGRQVLKGQQVFGSLPSKPVIKPSTPANGNEVNDRLFEQLRALRLRLSKERKIPSYMIFPDRTLREMASHRPKSKAELLKIHGVGEYKLEMYGDIFLEAIAAYESEITPSPPLPALQSKGSLAAQKRRAAAIKGLQAGQSLREVADLCGVKPTTVLGYVYREYQEKGKLPEKLNLPRADVSAEIHHQVFACFAELGTHALKPIYVAMNQQVEYPDLHLLRLEYWQFTS